MIKLYKKEQLGELKAKYSKEMLQEAEEIIVLLDDNYGANRDLDKDLGGIHCNIGIKRRMNQCI